MSKSIFAFYSIVVFTAVITAAFCFNVNADKTFTYEEAAEDKVVMVVADYLNIEDINRMEYLNKLIRESYVALMNNRQPGKASASKSKLIIGSGKRLELNTSMVLGGSEESLRELYQIESGGIPEPEGLVYVDIYKILDRNADSEYQNYIGYIGDIANRNNGVTCFLGNADTTKRNRSAMLIAMDSNGSVDIGETENILIYDKLFPYGKRTDFKRLAELYKQYLPASSFVVIDTGDMERLEEFRASMSLESYEAYKGTVLNSIDSFIKDLVNNGGFKTLVFASTYPSKTDSEANNRLTPVIVYETGQSGVMYSSNTRREGIILNTDMADYLLWKLGYLETSDITESSREKAGYYLETMNRNIVRTSAMRVPVLTFYAVMVIAALVMLFVFAVFSGKEDRYAWFKLRILIACAILAFPLGLLYISTPKFGKSSNEYIAFVSAASAFLSLILNSALKNKIKVILSVCLLLQIGLSVDILTGSTLIKQSVLGYDPIIGARFYGIGNEYAGMFIGCSLMVIGCLQELRGNRFNKAFTVLYFLACTSLLGLNFLGVNFGGALAGAVGYLLAYFLIYGIKFSKRNIFVGFLILFIAAVVLVLSDSLGLSSLSHVGGLVEDTKANGFRVITSTIKRKISMNLKLIRYTIWTKVLLCIIASISIMFYKPVKQLRYVFNSYKYLRYSWISIAASAITGFAINDSGIVVAATTMIYAGFTMLIMYIDERNEG